MLTLLLSLTALAGPVPDRIAGEAVPWDVEQVRAAMRIEIAAPPGLGKQQEDDTLRNQLRAKTEAVKQVVDVLTAAMAQHEAEVDIAALTTLAAVEEDFSQDLLASTVPSYLTSEQADAYRMALEDKAYPHLVQAREYEARAVWTAEEAGLWCHEVLRKDHADRLAEHPEEDPRRVLHGIAGPGKVSCDDPAQRGWVALRLGRWDAGLDLLKDDSGLDATRARARVEEHRGNLKTSVRILRQLIQREDASDAVFSDVVAMAGRRAPPSDKGASLADNARTGGARDLRKLDRWLEQLEDRAVDSHGP